MITTHTAHACMYGLKPSRPSHDISGGLFLHIFSTIPYEQSEGVHHLPCPRPAPRIPLPENLSLRARAHPHRVSTTASHAPASAILAPVPHLPLAPTRCFPWRAERRPSEISAQDRAFCSPMPGPRKAHNPCAFPIGFAHSIHVRAHQRGRAIPVLCCS